MLFFVALLALLNFFEIGYSSPIVGGKAVGTIFTRTDDEPFVTGKNYFPFMAYLKTSATKIMTPTLNETKHYQCGGVIITKNAVLTAAHCIPDDVGVPKILVRVGIVHLDYDKGQAKKMNKYMKHDQFVNECDVDGIGDLCLNDIAIVWVEGSFQFGPTVNKAEIIGSIQDIPINTNGWVIGWGVDENDDTTKMLRKATMTVFPNGDCERLHKGITITDNMICLWTKEQTVAICEGDSGGPFVVNGKVVGIASSNGMLQINDTEICDTTAPAIFTNIIPYKSWIFKQLEKELQPLKALRRSPSCSLTEAGPSKKAKL